MSEDPGSGSPMSERMQSLLSRAVEDQLSEQRQLAGALTEVRTQLAHLGGQLESIKGTPSDGSDRVEQGLAGIATDLREAVRILAERLDGVARLVQERGHDLAEQRVSIGELTTAVEAHTEALDGMTGGMAALSAFGERIDSLQSALSGMHDRLRGLEELTAAVTGMQQRAESHDNGLRELRQAFSGVAARAAQLPARDDIDAIVGRVGDSVDGISNRLGRIETSMPSLLERLDELAGTLARHGDGIAEVGEQVAGMASATPAGDAGGGAERAVALEASLDAVRERLDELHEQAGGAAVEELTGRLDELHEGLFGEEGLRAQVLALQPGAAEPADDRLAAAVARAVEETERRLTGHIDQAVLALAEALLKRRSARPRSDPPAAAVTTAPVAATLSTLPAAAAEDLIDDDGFDDGDDGVELPESRDPRAAAEVMPATDVVEVADEEPAEEEPADEDTGEPEPTVAAPSGTRPSWQTPSGATATGPGPTPAEEPRKRKWWRPGD